jgi:hypothetical protein
VCTGRVRPAIFWSPIQCIERLVRHPNAARARFRHRLESAMMDEIRGATNGNYATGNHRFQAEMEAALGRCVARRKAGRPPQR